MKDGVAVYEHIKSPPEEQVVANGLHQAIIELDVFLKAQEVMKRRTTAPLHKKAE